MAGTYTVVFFGFLVLLAAAVAIAITIARLWRPRAARRALRRTLVTLAVGAMGVLHMLGAETWEDPDDIARFVVVVTAAVTAIAFLSPLAVRMLRSGASRF